MKKLEYGTKLYRFNVLSVHPVTDELYPLIDEVRFISIGGTGMVSFKIGKMTRRTSYENLSSWSLTKADALKKAEESLTRDIEDIPRKLKRLEEDREVIRAAIAKALK